MSNQDVAKAEEAVAEARKVRFTVFLPIVHMKFPDAANVSRLFSRATNFLVHPILMRPKSTILGRLKSSKIS